jgi:hypothetical protein
LVFRSADNIPAVIDPGEENRRQDAGATKNTCRLRKSIDTMSQYFSESAGKISRMDAWNVALTVFTSLG